MTCSAQLHLVSVFVTPFVYWKDSITCEENVFVILFLPFQVLNQSQPAENNDEEQ